MPPDEINSEVIHTETMYGYKTRKPWVVIKWGNESGMLTPDEARRFALRVLAMAEASVGDAFWFEFAKNDVHLSETNAARLMGRFREYRLRTEDEN
jgi:hypothetical protein